MLELIGLFFAFVAGLVVGAWFHAVIIADYEKAVGMEKSVVATAKAMEARAEAVKKVL